MSADVVDARTGALVFRGAVVCVTRGAFVVLSPRGTWLYFAHGGRRLGAAADLRARETVS